MNGVLNYEDIKFGVRYQDNFTSFSGIATAKCEYMDSDAAVYLEPMVGDGKWVSVHRLVEEA